MVFVKQAGRMKAEFQGQGFNKQMNKVMIDYIKTAFPSDNCILMNASVPSWPSQLHGKQDDENPERIHQAKKDSQLKVNIDTKFVSETLNHYPCER